MVRLTMCCIGARSEMSYLNLYGTSANTDNYYDIGYLPYITQYFTIIRIVHSIGHSSVHEA